MDALQHIGCHYSGQSVLNQALTKTVLSQRAAGVESFLQVCAT